MTFWHCSWYKVLYLYSMYEKNRGNFSSISFSCYFTGKSVMSIFTTVAWLSVNIYLNLLTTTNPLSFDKFHNLIFLIILISGKLLILLQNVNPSAEKNLYIYQAIWVFSKNINWDMIDYVIQFVLMYSKFM